MDDYHLTQTGNANRRRRALDQAQRAAGRGLQLLQQQSSEHLIPRLEQFVEWATSEENIHNLQGILARTAQLGMNLGFSSDPRARILFEFVDWMESEHGREHVAPRVFAHNPLVDGSLIDMLEATLNPNHSPEHYATRIDTVRAKFMLMICSLAQLEDERPLPSSDDLQTLREHFESCIIPPQFHVLAGLGAGDPSAFEHFEQRERDRRERESASKRRGIRQRVFDRLQRAASTTPEEAEDPTTRSSALLRLTTGKRDPATSFLVQSYLFFFQSYMTRAMVEQFPDMVAGIKAQAQPDEDTRSPPDPDVIDL